MDDHVYTFTRMCQAARARGVPLYVLLLDLSKAYDSVWRERLMYRLLAAGVRGKLARVLWGMMSGTQSRVRLGEQLSEYFDVSQGVGQGDPLSTFLFNIFIDDLLRKLDARPAETKVPLGDALGRALAALGYADDVAAVAHTRQHLQGHIDEVTDWLQLSRLRANVDKSKFMVVNPREQDARVQFHMREIALDRVARYKYLGVWVSEGCDWHAHGEHVLCKMQRVRGYWRPLLSCGSLRAAAQVQFVRSFVMASALHCCAVWQVTQALQRRMSAAVHTALRSVFRVHRTVVPTDVLVGDTGLLPLSLQMQAMRVQWLARTERAPAERYISTGDTFVIDKPLLSPQPRRGRAPTGANWHRCTLAARDRLLREVRVATGGAEVAQAAQAAQAAAPLRRFARVAARAGTSAQTASNAARTMLASQDAILVKLWREWLRGLEGGRASGELQVAP